MEVFQRENLPEGDDEAGLEDYEVYHPAGGFVWPADHANLEEAGYFDKFLLQL
jgi:hypothetical protein